MSVARNRFDRKPEMQNKTDLQVSVMTFFTK